MSRDDIPPSLTQPCSAPVTIPERDLSATEVEVFWGRDRAALRNCRSRHEAVVQALQGKQA